LKERQSQSAHGINGQGERGDSLEKHRWFNPKTKKGLREIHFRRARFGLARMEENARRAGLTWCSATSSGNRATGPE
jgi:hypothetical protein